MSWKEKVLSGGKHSFSLTSARKSDDFYADLTTLDICDFLPSQTPPGIVALLYRGVLRRQADPISSFPCLRLYLYDKLPWP
jgi:hypothetical protein